MEDDLRRAMMLPATPTFPFSEDDEPDSLEYDPTTSLSAEMHELNLNFPPPEFVAEVAAEVASPTGGGSISEVLRVGLFPLPTIDCSSAAVPARFPPELKALFAYGSCAAFLPECLIIINV